MGSGGLAENPLDRNPLECESMITERALNDIALANMHEFIKNGPAAKMDRLKMDRLLVGFPTFLPARFHSQAVIILTLPYEIRINMSSNCAWLLNTNYSS